VKSDHSHWLFHHIPILIEITYTPFGVGAGTFSGAVLAGVGWYIGVGSLDLGVSIGNQVTGMVGFTFIPKLKSKKLE